MTLQIPRTFVHLLEARLESVLDNPKGWGGIEALEPLVLLLCIQRAELATPPVCQVELLQSYWAFLARRIGPGAGGLRERLGAEASAEAMISILREFSASSPRPGREPPG